MWYNLNQRFNFSESAALVAKLHDLRLRRCYKLLNGNSSSPKLNSAFFPCRLVNSFWFEKNSSWTDLNHRSPVYETGALTANPQDLKPNCRFVLTIGIIANTVTELFSMVIVSYTVWRSKGRFGDL